MKKLLLSILIFSVTTVSAAPPKVTLTAMKFSPPEPERIELSNGVSVYFKEDHELPLVHFSITLKAVPSYEKAVGAFQLLGAVWRAGGTKKLSPDQLNDELEFLAAAVETSASGEEFSVTASCLKKDLDRTLDIFADVLFNPRWDDQQITLQKGKMLEAIRRKNETPAQIGRRLFRDVIYGPTHYYATDPTPESLKAIKKADLERMHKTVVVPDGAVMAVAGDITPQVFLFKLEERFKKWTKTGRTLPSYDYAPKSPAAGTVFFVDKDSPQSRISIGRLSFTRLSPDEYAIRLADYMFGGGGPSRLFNEIRSRQGLAYVVGSFYTAFAGPGMVGAICQTRAESTPKAVSAMLKEFKKFSQVSPSSAEIKLAKDATINSFVFGFDSAYEVASQKASEEFYGYPDDHIRTYTRRIAALTPAEIMAVIKKYYGSEGLKIVVVGSEKRFSEPLSSLGPIVVVPLAEVQ